jgi:hypothetical protein
LRPAVEKYCQDYEEELEEDILSSKDWKKLRTIKDFLAPFARATLATEGDSTSLDSTLFIMDILIKHLQEETISPLPFSYDNTCQEQAERRSNAVVLKKN